MARYVSTKNYDKNWQQETAAVICRKSLTLRYITETYGKRAAAGVRKQIKKLKAAKLCGATRLKIYQAQQKGKI